MLSHPYLIYTLYMLRIGLNKYLRNGNLKLVSNKTKDRIRSKLTNRICLCHHVCSWTWKYETLCAIGYHLYNLKNVNNTHGVSFLVKLQASTYNFTKTLLHGRFSQFLNWKSRTKLLKASQFFARKLIILNS